MAVCGGYRLMAEANVRAFVTLANDFWLYHPNDLGLADFVLI
jgi:hypothetical protein